jgi:hypothetical protein
MLSHVFYFSLQYTHWGTCSCFLLFRTFQPAQTKWPLQEHAAAPSERIATAYVSERHNLNREFHSMLARFLAPAPLRPSRWLSLRKPFWRQLSVAVAAAERPSGPGGVQRRCERIVPGERARQEHRTRLRHAVDVLNNRIYPFLRQKEDAETGSERVDLLAIIEQDSSRFENEQAIRDWVEAQIQEAIRHGDFEELPRGPLSIPQPPPGVDFVTFTMHGLLQRHGLRPPWIERMHEVDAEVKRIRITLERAFREQFDQQAETPEAATRRARRWEAAAAEIKEQMRLVNRRIDEFNLMKPERLDTVFRLRMRWELELAQVERTVLGEQSREKLERSPAPPQPGARTSASITATLSNE